MDTTTISNVLDAYAQGAEDFAGPSTQSLVAPFYESAPSTANEHAQKDPSTGDSLGWACLHGWRFEAGEPPLTHGERTVPQSRRASRRTRDQYPGRSD